MLYFSKDKLFISQVVQKLASDLPPSSFQNTRKVLSVNKVASLLEDVCKACQSYQKENKIGFLRRVVLLNNFKWAMKEQGYSSDFIETATESVIFSLMKNK